MMNTVRTISNLCFRRLDGVLNSQAPQELSKIIDHINVLLGKEALTSFGNAPISVHKATNKVNAILYRSKKVSLWDVLAVKNP